MRDVVIKTDSSTISYGKYKQENYDFWFDPSYYSKHNRLSITDKEKQRRENLLKEQNKFNIENE